MENAARTDAQRRLGAPAAHSAWRTPKTKCKRASKHGRRFVGIGEPDYPRMLRHMDYPPPLVAVKGNAEVFKLPAVAIVGARNASLVG